MNMERPQYDVVFIGGGPGGYVGAIRAAQREAKVAVIEKAALGGVCLHKGCIPTKTLIASVGVLRTARNLDRFGIKIDSQPVPDMDAMQKRREKVVANMLKGIGSLMRANNIDVIKGHGRLLDKNRIGVEGVKNESGQMEIDAEKIVLATGSRSVDIPGLEVDGERVLHSDHILERTDIPGSLLIVGAGAIGCEWACIYAALGSKVTIVEIMDRALPMEDEDISRIFQRELKKQKIKFKHSVKIEKLENMHDKIIATLEGGETIEADQALVSIGRECNTSDMGLENAGIETGEGGSIEVNDKMETSVSGIYAIGDIVPGPMLAHVASAEGLVAAENATGGDAHMDYNAIPSVTFTYPEVASVGKNEKQAAKDGLDVKTGWCDFRTLGKAQTTGELSGAVKVVADGDGKILGVHMIGHGASDLIHEGVLAVRYGMKVDQLAGAVHAHPTLAETLMEATEDVNGRAIHIPPKR